MPSMPWSTILAMLRKGGPALLKMLPKLWPLLLDRKNRKALVGAARDLASLSPERRLRGGVEGTLAVAEHLVVEASSDPERERAQTWVTRAKHLLHQLDMPVTGRSARTRRRKSVGHQLEALQAEMEDHLRGA